MSVVALGGYARRELCPASDIDLLLLHDGWDRPDLSELVEALCYPLWDAKLSVGHAVRTPAQAVADAGDRIDSATALLDRRLVAGDRGLYDGLASRVQRWSRRNAKSVIRQLADADHARHQTSGSHTGMLEPDLKNGAGGLRDIHSLRWAAALLLGDLGLDPLVAAGYLGAADRSKLGAANSTLLRARCALHEAADDVRGKGVDVLRLDRQDEVAAALGEGTDADALLRDVGLAMRTVSHLHGRTWDLLIGDVSRGRRRRRSAGRDLGDGLHLDGGLVHLDPTVTLRVDPAAGLRAMAVAATHGAHLSRATATALQRQTTEAGALPWTAGARGALVTLLQSGSGVADALAEADHVGLLAAHLPEWDVVRGRPQRNALHRYDVDSHGAEAVVALHALRHDDDLDLLRRQLRDPDALVLATWLHDVGKAWPGDHSEAGAQVARRWLDQMGFSTATVDRVAALVRHHLLLPDTATRRDLDDPAEITAVAQTISDVELLDGLYLLTLADGRATGPAAWSPWKDSLLATLHRRVRALLTGSDIDIAPDPRPGALEAGVSQTAIDALTAAAPERYFALADIAQVVAHATLLADTGGGVHARSGPVPGTTVVSVVAEDRPGLVADCAGVLAAVDLNVVSAQAVTGPTGLALDWFTVTGAVDDRDLTTLLVDAVEGRVDVHALLVRPRRGRSHVAVAALRRRSRVTLRDSTTVEVEAPDSPFLLYRLCAAVADTGYALEAVRASTLGPTVFDVFDVRRAGGTASIDELRDAMAAAAELVS